MAIDQGRPFGLEGILQSGVEAPKEAVRLLAEISEAVAARARLALERLGPLPKDQYTRHFSLRTALNKPWRNGMTTSVELLIESEENNFRDKLLDPTFGGAGFPPRFPSSLTFGLLMPLGKGRGATSVAAQERASVFTLRAREEQARQVATEEVYRTLLAYIRLIAAQDNLKLAQASSERQKVLVGLTDQRVRGGEAARVEGFRAQARAAFVDSSVAGAKAELVDARMSLAEAMGVDAATLGEAPAAADRFADVRVDQQTVAALIASAMESRRDRLALDQARRASAELAAGARDDTRRVYDLNFSGGLAQSYESEIFRFLPDEQNPIFSELNPPIQFDETHRYYSPRGYWRGLTGRWEPFITASISFEIPLGNNAAKGRLAQAQATLRSSEIQYRDRTRLIGDNITGVVQTLRAAAEGVQRAREAVERTTTTYEGALSQLRAGELTLIDTLTTEEELLGDQTELLRQQQVYLSTLARLRFESGQLVTFSGLGDASESPGSCRPNSSYADRRAGDAAGTPGRVVAGGGVRHRRFRVVHPEPFFESLRPCLKTPSSGRRRSTSWRHPSASTSSCRSPPRWDGWPSRPSRASWSASSCGASSARSRNGSTDRASCCEAAPTRKSVRPAPARWPPWT